MEESEATNEPETPQRESSRESPKKKVNIDSFEFFGMIGEGGYGKVYMAKKKTTGKLYAIK